MSAASVSYEDLEGKIVRLKNQLDTIGGMDELTLKEYQETETRYTNLSTQVGDLKHGMADLRQSSGDGRDAGLSFEDGCGTRDERVEAVDQTGRLQPLTGNGAIAEGDGDDGN